VEIEMIGCLLHFLIQQSVFENFNEYFTSTEFTKMFEFIRYIIPRKNEKEIEIFQKACSYLFNAIRSGEQFLRYLRYHIFR
jgi:hypothetical protein